MVEDSDDLNVQPAKKSKSSPHSKGSSQKASPGYKSRENSQSPSKSSSQKASPVSKSKKDSQSPSKGSKQVKSFPTPVQSLESSEEG